MIYLGQNIKISTHWIDLEIPKQTKKANRGFRITYYLKFGKLRVEISADSNFFLPK